MNKETEALREKLDGLVAKIWEMAQNMQTRSAPVYEQNVVKRECSKAISCIFEEAGMVILAEDQSLPEPDLGIDGEGCDITCHKVEQKNMLKANFRKIRELEDK